MKPLIHFCLILAFILFSIGNLEATTNPENDVTEVHIVNNNMSVETSTVTINFNSKVEELEITIMDINGNELSNIPVSDGLGRNSITIPTHRLANKTYFVKIETAESLQYHKFEKAP